MVKVLEEIAKIRKIDIANKGFDFGHVIPKHRVHPLIKPNLDSVFIIAEIKRASPSAGRINDIECVEELARDYLNGGASAISVLCEERHFNGSLNDLMSVKNAYPKACILRKDFIQYVEEIEISYRAGADMVLLIAAMFIHENNGFAHFENLYRECLKYGITPLVEVHTQEEIEFIASLKPEIIGINSRNLNDFTLDIPLACTLYHLVSKAKVIFESGIDSASFAYMIGSIGFDGILCGSYLVKEKNPSYAIQSLKAAINRARKDKPKFYNIIFRKFLTSKPLIKICGITSLNDALLISQENVAGGVDMLGFILVKHSPRFIDSKHIKEICKAVDRIYPNILRICVVNDKQSLESAKALYENGLIDAIQLHGIDRDKPHIFANTDLNNAMFAYYGVQNITCKDDFTHDFRGAFCLIDSKSGQGGGSGISVKSEVLQSLNVRYLCIAGGIKLENIREFLNLKPYMLDINTGVEKEVGKKDISKLKALLQEIDKVKNLECFEKAPS